MKTDFVANASHELRTPIAAIKIAMETLRDAYGDDPRQAERCVDIIDGHVQRLEDLLRDLLDLSRLESPDARPSLADVKPWDLFAVVRSPSARRPGRRASTSASATTRSPPTPSPPTTACSTWC